MARAYIIGRYYDDFGIDELTTENYSCAVTEDGLHDWDCGCGSMVRLDND